MASRTRRRMSPKVIHTARRPAGRRLGPAYGGRSGRHVRDGDAGEEHRPDEARRHAAGHVQSAGHRAHRTTATDIDIDIDESVSRKGSLPTVFSSAHAAPSVTTSPHGARRVDEHDRTTHRAAKPRLPCAGALSISRNSSGARKCSARRFQSVSPAR